MKINSTLGHGPKKKKKIAGATVSAKGKKKTTGRNDTVADVSADVSLMQKAGEIMKTVPDVREQKVKDLKKKIKDGGYKVDSKKVADRLIEEHLKTDFEKK